MKLLGWIIGAAVLVPAWGQTNELPLYDRPGARATLPDPNDIPLPPTKVVAASEFSARPVPDSSEIIEVNDLNVPSRPSSEQSYTVAPVMPRTYNPYQ